MFYGRFLNVQFSTVRLCSNIIFRKIYHGYVLHSLRLKYKKTLKKPGSINCSVEKGTFCLHLLEFIFVYQFYPRMAILV